MRLEKAVSIIFCGVGLSVALSASALAQCSSPPNNLTNGQVTDATQVMGNFNHLTTCINSGQLTVPPVSSLSVTGSGGGTITINNPVNSSPYTLSLPSGPGASGQVLSTDGSGQTSWSSASSATHLPLVDGLPVGRPAASALSWLNQGTATYTEYSNGPISLSIPAVVGDQLRGLGQTPPGSTPYTLTVKLDFLLWGVNWSTAGIYVRDSAGKLIGMHEQGTGGSPTLIQVNHYNSVSSFNSTAKQVSVNAPRTIWFRVRNDGTNWNFYISPNGADWIFIYAEALTSYLGSTITSVGVYGDNNNSTALNQNVSIWSFELATGSGTDASWQ